MTLFILAFLATAAYLTAGILVARAGLTTTRRLPPDIRDDLHHPAVAGTVALLWPWMLLAIVAVLLARLIGRAVLR